MMDNEFWSYIFIAVHPFKKEKDEYGSNKVNYYHYHTLREWRYPKWIYEKHRSFFTWVMAIYQVRFRNHYISLHYCGYHPETNERINSKRKRKISAAKSQLTKYENKMQALKDHCQSTLFNDHTQHPLFPKINSKIEENKYKLEQAIMSEIEETI